MSWSVEQSGGIVSERLGENECRAKSSLFNKSVQISEMTRFVFA